MGEYLKNEFGVAGCTGHGDTGLQNTENAHVQAKKNQCSPTNFINICV